MNSIHWTRKSVKQLLRLHTYPQQQVRNAVSALERMPDAVNVKALVNHPHGYRLWVGNYRVLFDCDGDIHGVSIQEVKKRD
ncbi:hypothetical protein [Pseudomonas sp. 37 R 15]|uniref:type II toxin-antitoxin system RelE family toxin n=1 Tax=Pseudomonas sp. 37 R 15 TaxID=1844104 RepID=UPI0008125A6E|nr:cytotoxic translational repressor of toxin-antitoxin stability system [Pseudomonas sp. 37 R 15]CRM23250.1 hypothetical protein [Pseudomonas sp. 37 R 15]